MRCHHVLPAVAICMMSTLAVAGQEPAVLQFHRSGSIVDQTQHAGGVRRYAQMRMMGQGMQGQGTQGMMGGRPMGSGRSAPGDAGRQPTEQGGGTETICGFAGGNPTRGGAIYEQTCVACHGANGRGSIPGAPDFNRKRGVLSKPHSTLQAHIENGFSSPNAPISMPPRGGSPGLTDQDIRDVHAYLHKRFGCG